MLFLHGPVNVTDLIKNVPRGTDNVDGLTELHAAIHARRNAKLESVLPSPLAPKLTTLYANAPEGDDINSMINARKCIQEIALNLDIFMLLLNWE